MRACGSSKIGDSSPSAWHKDQTCFKIPDAFHVGVGGDPMGRSDELGAPGLKPDAVPSEPPIPALAPVLRLAAEAPAGAGSAGTPPDASDDATLPAVRTSVSARDALPNDALPGYDLLREISR